MLDAVSLRSDHCRDIFQIFYELYMMTADFEQNPKLSLRPTSVFIVRACLGWLFDQTNVPNEYYSYRQMRNPLNTLMLLPLPLPQTKYEHSSELIAVEIFVPKTISAFFQSNERTVFIGDYKHNETHQLSGTIEKLNTDPYHLSDTKHIQHQQSRNDDDNVNKNDSDLMMMKKFDPLLESVLHAACPFLADFRVSIMPRRNSKVLSRTGRLRHITPKIFEKSTKPTQSTQPTSSTSISMGTTATDTATTTKTTAETASTTASTSTSKSNQINDDDTQTKLVDAFLHSQSLSVRRTVEFVQERVYSAVVKDFQVEILIPFKKTIVETIDKIQLNDSQAILDELYRIYANGEKTLLEKWQDFVISAALERVKVNTYSYAIAIAIFIQHIYIYKKKSLSKLKIK